VPPPAHRQPPPAPPAPPRPPPPPPHTHKYTLRPRSGLPAACSYPIQQGCLLSRARTFTFKHNDMADLEALLQRLDQQDRRAR